MAVDVWQPASVGQGRVYHVVYDWEAVDKAALDAALVISQQQATKTSRLLAYPIPTAGLHAASAIKSHLDRIRFSMRLVENPEEADIYLDDIVDSGKTRDLYFARHGKKPFYSLVDKKSGDPWVSFPWDRMAGESGPEQNVRRLLQFMGEDPEREGLRETPGRVTRSYKELFSGYNYKEEDVAKTLKVFKDGACDEMVVLRDIEFVSFCEHHMLPFTGSASIAYIPDGKVVGVSKLARLLEIYSRRLQIQERLTQQITMALDKYLTPLGSACVIRAKHLCMSCRGVGKRNATMVTSSLTGAFREAAARQEFLMFIR